MSGGVLNVFMFNRLSNMVEGGQIIVEKQVEKNFVMTYIVKEKRERLLYELFNKKKRLSAIGRFCHTTMKYIDARKILYCGNKISQKELLELVHADDKCYIISWKSDIDGNWLNAEEALMKIIGYGMPSIAIFNDLVIIETEQELGAAQKYVLRSKP